MKFDPQKTIFLIDGSSFLYRAYYSMRPLHTLHGEPVQAVYGFCRMIKKIIDTFSPAYCVLVWDSKGKTTRHEIFQEYKATRQAPPSDIFDQKKYIIEFANLIGLKQISQKGIEADDIMFSIAKEQKKNSDSIVLVTADKDMAQMLDKKTFMYDTFKHRLIDVSAFEKLWGFGVKKLPFYFALLGDTSDNIPGVRGIGKKGAAELVARFESLEDLYEHLDNVARPNIRKKLKEGKDYAFLSRELFLLQYHPTGLKKKDMSFDARNWIKARKMFVELNFKSLIKDMDNFPGIQDQKIKHWQTYDFKLITTQQGLDELCGMLKRKKIFAIDTETTGVKALQEQLVGISFCAKEGQAYYVPCAHNVEEKHLSLDEVLACLKPLLEDEHIKKYLHNAKFDQLVFWGHGIQLKGVVFDTMIAASLVARDGQRSNLKYLSQYYCGEAMLSYADTVKAHNYKDFSYVPFDQALLYSAADAHQTFKLKKILAKELKNQKVFELFHEIELPLIQVLFKMEAEGIFLDVKMLKGLDKKITVSIKKIELRIGELIAKKYASINLNSPKQVEQLLFYDLKLPPQKKSAKKTGYSTDQEVLTALSRIHPVPGLILKYRELSKLKNTYIDALPTYVNPKTKRIHTNYNQIIVATGRLASSEPNMQNIPTNSFGIRTAFKPREGNVFLSADYSQIELRVLAYLSQDKNLRYAFLGGHDIHAETAARLFDVKLGEITHDQRQIGKRINFSILYGLTPYGLSKDLGISFKDAKHYIEKYFAQYPGVSRWMEHIITQTKKHGYVKTLYGRRRYVPAIYEDNKSMYEEACRTAINTVAQGTAAEVMKLGMLDLDRTFCEKRLRAKLILQIHDELLISVPEDQQRETEQVVKKVLESVVDWNVPLEVKIRVGHNWAEVTK